MISEEIIRKIIRNKLKNKEDLKLEKKDNLTQKDIISFTKHLDPKIVEMIIKEKLMEAPRQRSSSTAAIPEFETLLNNVASKGKPPVKEKETVKKKTNKEKLKEILENKKTPIGDKLNALHDYDKSQKTCMGRDMTKRIVSQGSSNFKVGGDSQDVIATFLNDQDNIKAIHDFKPGTSEMKKVYAEVVLSFYYYTAITEMFPASDMNATSRTKKTFQKFSSYDDIKNDFKNYLSGEYFLNYKTTGIYIKSSDAYLQDIVNDNGIDSAFYSGFSHISYIELLRGSVDLIVNNSAPYNRTLGNPPGNGDLENIFRWILTIGNNFLRSEISLPMDNQEQRIYKDIELKRVSVSETAFTEQVLDSKEEDQGDREFVVEVLQNWKSTINGFFTGSRFEQFCYFLAAAGRTNLTNPVNSDNQVIIRYLAHGKTTIDDSNGNRSYSEIDAILTAISKGSNEKINSSILYSFIGYLSSKLGQNDYDSPSPEKIDEMIRKFGVGSNRETDADVMKRAIGGGDDKFSGLTDLYDGALRTAGRISRYEDEIKNKKPEKLRDNANESNIINNIYNSIFDILENIDLNTPI